MSLIGQRIAHYEITEKIGQGGMGEVYRARDTKLDRDVALKLLPENLAVDTDRLARLEREAKLLASLNHTNIAAIYGMEHWQGRHALVLELVEGEDLQERLTRGPIAVNEALRIALQICEALEAAHGQGVIHRDLKPANVKVNPDGNVKVLDFGLAKAMDFAEDSGLSQSPTMLASSPTMQGVIMGTAAYMSPEQARGKRVDRRADVFAFGALLFEMLTAQRCFMGDTISDILASVLKEGADLHALPDETPQAIHGLIKRCLDKDLRQRLQDIGEARIILEKVTQGEWQEERRSVAVSRTARVTPLGIAAVVLAVIATLGLASVLMKPAEPQSVVRKFRVPVALQGSQPSEPTIAPDGTRFAYVLGGRLLVQSFAELDPLELEAGKGPTHPFWSPDGAQIGYFSEGRMWRIPATGGSRTLVCTPSIGISGGTGGAWTEDGRIVFSTGASGLRQVSAQGGDDSECVPLREGEEDFHEPCMLPGDRGLVYTIHGPREADRIVLETDGKRTPIFEAPGIRLRDPRYSPSGHIVFQRTGSSRGIWAVPFSLASLTVTGDAFIVVAGGSQPSVSRDGTLVYFSGSEGSSMVLRWLDRDGTLSEPLSEPGTQRAHASFAPDHHRIVVAEQSENDAELWIYDLQRQTRTRFTFFPGNDIYCEWSKDGEYIYWWNASADSVYRKPASGRGAREGLLAGGMPSVSADQRYIAFKRAVDNQPGDDVYFIDLQSGQLHPVATSSADEDAPLISPDGRYLLYDSNESGRWESYVTTFPELRGKWQVSNGDYSYGGWGADGSTVFYTNDSGDIYEVDFTDGPNGIVLSAPRVRHNANEVGLMAPPFRYIAQSPTDPDKLLVQTNLDRGNREISTSLIIVENWFSEFE